jgi:hypothetical protein
VGFVVEIDAKYVTVTMALVGEKEVLCGGIVYKSGQF